MCCIHCVERTKLLDAGLHHGINLFTLGHIGYSDARLATKTPDLVGNLFAALLVGRDVVDAHVIAVARETQGNGLATIELVSN